MTQLFCYVAFILLSISKLNFGFNYGVSSCMKIRSSRLYLDTTKSGVPVSGENNERKDLWKKVSLLERRAVELLTKGDEDSVTEAFKSLAESIHLKKSDPFLMLAENYGLAAEKKDIMECDILLAKMKNVGVPPHIAGLASKKALVIATSDVEEDLPEDVDPGSTFSDTVTEKIRVKVNSFYDVEKSDPTQGKYMFWYKVAIYNEGPEPVQVVARMWDIEKCRGDKETVRGSGIMSTQPIIAPGDVFTYQSVCPLKVFPPKGKRMLGSMSGMCMCSFMRVCVCVFM